MNKICCKNSKEQKILNLEAVYKLSKLSYIFSLELSYPKQKLTQFSVVHYAEMQIVSQVKNIYKKKYIVVIQNWTN